MQVQVLYNLLASSLLHNPCCINSITSPFGVSPLLHQFVLLDVSTLLHSSVWNCKHPVTLVTLSGDKGGHGDVVQTIRNDFRQCVPCGATNSRCEASLLGATRRRQSQGSTKPFFGFLAPQNIAPPISKKNQVNTVRIAKSLLLMLF